MSIFGFRDKNDLRHCIVVYTHVESQHADLFIEGGSLSYPFHGSDIAIGQYLKVLGRFNDRIAIHVTDRGKEAILLVGSPGEETWHSNWYDKIIDGSTMLREGKFSFVGFNKVYPDHDGVNGLLRGTGDLFMAGLGSEEKITSCVLPDKVHCLPSGRILICGHARDGIFLRDVGANSRIELKGVKELGEIVEIPSGLVTKVVKHDGSHGLGVIHENRDVVSGLLDLFSAKEVWYLRRWGNHLVFKTSDRGHESLRIVNVEGIERWLVQSDDDAYSDSIGYYPLYTRFEWLVPTEEGILSWHFVNGTFHIIRYPLSE